MHKAPLTWLTQQPRRVALTTTSGDQQRNEKPLVRAEREIPPTCMDPHALILAVYRNQTRQEGCWGCQESQGHRGELVVQAAGGVSSCLAGFQANRFAQALENQPELANGGGQAVQSGRQKRKDAGECGPCGF